MKIEIEITKHLTKIDVSKSWEWSVPCQSAFTNFSWLHRHVYENVLLVFFDVLAYIPSLGSFRLTRTSKSESDGTRMNVIVNILITFTNVLEGIVLYLLTVSDVRRIVI